MDHSGLTTCNTCHMDDFPRGPKHTISGFPTNCATCHTPTTWNAATMNHSGLTNCASCHAAEFASGGGPMHTQPGFPTSCANCHTTASWSGATMNHTGLTNCYSCHADRYTSQSTHVNARFSHTCTDCHAGTSSWSNVTMNHTGYQQNCIGCHMVDFRDRAPQHVTRQYPYDCNTSCHNTNGWARGPFTHQPISRNGEQAPADHYTFNCTSCHTNLLSTTQLCGNCHRD